MTARLLIAHTVPNMPWHFQCIRKTYAAAVRLPPPEFQDPASSPPSAPARARAQAQAQAQFLHLHCVRIAVCSELFHFRRQDLNVSSC